MKPLHVALVVKASAASFQRERRQMGMFSYAVPEFSWEHYVLGKAFDADRSHFARLGFNLVFHEDGGNWGRYTGSGIPVVYHAIDSTLSERHYLDRLAQAAEADLVLVEQDTLARFKSSRRPVARLNYAVNDHVFYPRPKTVDVAFHGTISTPGKSTRLATRDAIDAWCAERDRSFSDGPLGLGEYAHALGSARVVVNWPRVPGNRSHRIFDALASGAAVVTGGFPRTEGDGFSLGVPYWAPTPQDVPKYLSHLFSPLDESSCVWERIARASAALIAERHTWAIRARELRTLLATYFPSLG